MNKFNILFVFSILVWGGKTFAQVKPVKLSFEVNAGVPIMFGSIPSTLSTYGGVGLRYNFNTALSAQVSVNMGTMKGYQDQTAPKFLNPEEVSNYKSYQSNFLNYALRGQLNLEKSFNLRKYGLFKWMNPYLIAGFGYTAPTSGGWEAERYFGAKTKTYKEGVKAVWTSQIGMALRFYLNPILDLNIGSEFNHCQTYYLDGIYPDKKYDHYLTTYAGINIKIGASKSKQHIEWQNIGPRKIRIKDHHKSVQEPTQAIVNNVPPAKDTVVQSPSDPAIVKPNTDSVQAIVPEKQTNLTDTLTVMPEVNPTVKPEQKTLVTTPTVIAKSTAKKPKAVTGKGYPKEGVVIVDAARDKNAPTLNMIEGVAEKSPAKYTVIAGAYSKGKVSYAYMFRDRLRKQGYQAALLQSDLNPNIVRVMVYTTNNKKVAIEQCYKVRSEFEKSAWINVKK